MNKKSLSEASIISKYILPSVEDAGWDKQKQIAQEISFTDGRIIVRKKVVTRGIRKRADIILYYKSNMPLAIIEAKDNTHSIDAGMQQGLNYGEILDIPFVYSSNGDGFIEHDRTKTEGQIERELTLEQFPSPEELWNRYKAHKGLTDEQEEVVKHNYYYDQDCFPPRYYQRIAINRSIEAITQGEDKILLVMATAQPSLSMETIRKVKVALPPLNEQKRIVEKVDSLMQLCDELEKKIEKSKKYSQKLMESILKNSFKA